MRTGAEPTSSPAWFPEGAGSARWIVCERTGSWATALRRESAAAAIRVYETRSLAECWEMLAQRPSSFLVVELTRSNAHEVLQRLARLGTDFPLARAAVVAGRPLGPYEELMREAGAVWFAGSPLELTAVAEAAGGHLRMAPGPPQGLVERIWANLPWGKPEQL